MFLCLFVSLFVCLFVFFFASLLFVIVIPVMCFSEVLISNHPSGSKSDPSSSQKSQIMFALENILYVLISQAQQMMMDGNINPADIYHLRRELGMELVSTK